MQSGELSHLHFKNNKCRSAWVDAIHWVHEGDPVFEVKREDVRTCYRFSMGYGGRAGQAYCSRDGGCEEVRSVIFQAGGPICPFTSKLLPAGVQSYILGGSFYMMPLLNSVTPGLPDMTVLAIDSNDDNITFQWFDQPDCELSCMRLILRIETGEGRAWACVWKIVGLSRWVRVGGGRFHKQAEVRVYQSFVKPAVLRFTYIDAEGHEVCLPKGVFDLMTQCNRKRAMPPEVLSVAMRKPQSSFLFCKHCDMWLNGPEQFGDHWGGRKHQRRVGCR